MKWTVTNNKSHTIQKVSTLWKRPSRVANFSAGTRGITCKTTVLLQKNDRLCWHCHLKRKQKMLMVSYVTALQWTGWRRHTTVCAECASSALNDVRFFWSVLYKKWQQLDCNGCKWILVPISLNTVCWFIRHTKWHIINSLWTLLHLGITLGSSAMSVVVYYCFNNIYSLIF